MKTLIAPYGEKLQVLYLANGAVDAERRRAMEYPSWHLTDRQICDLELLMNGAFSPLTGFMCRDEYESVVRDSRLENGMVWTIPIVLDVDGQFADKVTRGTRIALRDREGVLVATMTVDSKWTPDLEMEARAVYGTSDPAHPGVFYLLHKSKPVCLGGPVTGIEPPACYDFKHLRDDPAALRQKFRKRGWSRVVAFQTRNPMHRAHFELTCRAAKASEADLLLHPVVGMTKPGDVDHYTRVRCYEQVLRRYPEQTTIMSLLPLAMRMAGPREAVWHAIIRRNFGCSAFIVGRDHAGPGNNGNGASFYDPYAAQQLVRRHEDQLQIEMIPFEEMMYVPERGQYVPRNEVRQGETPTTISGTELRRRLRDGIDIPEWFSFPEVLEELRRSFPPRHRQGFVIFFTGLPSSGKSTIANALLAKLNEDGTRPVTILDGDEVRRHLSSELGFSREHRNLNVLRIGYVAGLIAKSGGIAICAPIAPYENIRRQVRELVEATGGFIEVHVATPVDVCEKRDRKGLYAKARAGLLENFTGVNDPYELPVAPDLRIDTREYTPAQAAQQILLKIEAQGYIR
ncbi:MAG TPA: bifunctional sulfate adenylyltransferase/adenylylsulfate kinase [Dongiaceae bacterium]|nr:bifunctional sulfate adenylyltransferase/adenylylsulfate kinase [Dongiaceae bacterium]